MQSEIVLLSVLILGLVFFCAFLVVKVPTSYRLKFLLVPVVIGLGLLLINDIPKLMGSPIDGYPADKFKYLGHTIVKDKKGKMDIQLWADVGKGKTKVFEFKFDQKILDKLAEMQKEAQQGHPASGKFVKGKGEGGNKGSKNGSRDGEEWYELDVENPNVTELLPPKDETTDGIEQ